MVVGLRSGVKFAACRQPTAGSVWAMSDERLTIDDFTGSLSYGTRTDLAFKFLENLEDGEVAGFFEELLRLLGDAADTGDARPLIDLYIRFQQLGYRPKGERRWVYPDGPFTDLPGPVSGSSIGLITSSGHFPRHEDPKPFGVSEMTQEEAIARIAEFLRAAPQLAAIPAATDLDDLDVRHGGYDVRGARRDPGVAFPLGTLRDLEAAGIIGRVADPVFSFVGATAQKRLLNEALPSWRRPVRETGADVLLLVPL